MLGITLTLLAVLVSLWAIWRKRKFLVLKNMGIPGPEPNFFFGNMLELSSKTPIVCHKEWIKKYGNVVGYYYGTSPTVLVADTELLKKIQVSEFQHFMNRPGTFGSVNKKDPFGNQLISLKDKRWKEIRSTLTPSFTASKMKTMAPLINDAIDTFMQNIEKNALEGTPFDIYTMYQGLTMDVIGRTAFGIVTDCQRNPEDPFLRSCRVIFSGHIQSLLFIIGMSFREFRALLRPIVRLFRTFQNKGTNPFSEFLKSTKKVINTRTDNPENRRPDLLQAMIDAKVGQGGKLKDDDLIAGEQADVIKTENDFPEQAKPTTNNLRSMSEMEILGNAMLFFLAGYETTSTALAFVTHFLVKYEEIQDRVREEVQNLIEREGQLNYTSVQQLQYLDQVLTEALRIYPPVYLFVEREVGKDIQLGGFSLKKGMTVQVPVYTLQHSEEHWPDPETFDPERFSPENKHRNNQMAFQAFGNGPRNCIGMRFAQMEAKLTLARLLAKYKLIPSKDTEVDVELKVGPANLTPKTGIHLKVITLR